MYSISKAFREALRWQTKSYTWSGTITCKDGTVYGFGPSDIPTQNAGSITRRVSDGAGLELGSTCAAELDITLLLDVDRYKLYDAEISLRYTQTIGAVRTWGDAAAFSWRDAATAKWGTSRR